MNFSWGNCLAANDTLTLQCLPVLFGSIINWLLIFSGVAAVAFIMIAGFRYIGSGGDPKQIDTAKKSLMFAIIGLVVILVSFFLLNFIAGVTGAGCITQFGFGNCHN